MQPHREKKTWPLKWVALAIVLTIVPYTFLTLRFRRPEPAYRPYEEGKSRATTGKLLDAGYQRIALEARRPAPARDAAVAAALTTAPGPGGVPDALKTVLIDQPALVESIDRVAAASAAASGDRYAIALTCTLTDNQQQIVGAALYRRGEQLLVVPELGKVGSGLLARSRQQTIILEAPPGALKPGTYAVTVVGGRSSRGWTLQVH